MRRFPRFTAAGLLLLVFGTCGATHALHAFTQVAGQVRPAPRGDPSDPPPKESPKEPPETPPDSPEPPDSPDVVISGDARLTWDQPVDDLFPLHDLSFRLYVDGAAADMTDIRCQGTPGPDGHVCDGRLPALAPGTHELRVAAAATVGDVTLEGPTSFALRVVVRDESAEEDAEVTFVSQASGGGALVAANLDDATDIALLPDGRALVSERAGRIVAVSGDRTDALLTIDDVVRGEGHGLLSLAIDPRFEETGFVFAAYSAPEGLRVVRFEMAGRTLTSRVVLLEGLPLPASAPKAVVRIGPDRALYLALGHDDPARTFALGDLAGKLLRVTVDGATPDDQPAGMPVIVTGVRQPTALAWSDDATALWVVDSDADGRLVLHRKPVATPMRRNDATRLVPMISAATPDASVIVVGMHLGPRRVFAIAPDGAVGARISPAESADVGGRIRAVAVAADGVLYVCTADAVVRIELPRR